MAFDQRREQAGSRPIFVAQCPRTNPQILAHPNLRRTRGREFTYPASSRIVGHTPAAKLAPWLITVRPHIAPSNPAF